MTSIDQQFVEYIVKSLVGNPDAVSIERRIDEKGVLLELTVDPEDLGRVIGKRGATAQSLRTLLRALGTKNEARYNLKIIDNGEPRPPREDRSDAPARDDRSEFPAPANDNADNSSATDDNSNDSSTNDDTASAAPASDDSWGSSSTTAPASTASDDLDLDDDEAEPQGAGDKLSRTREELKDLDDLDV